MATKATLLKRLEESRGYEQITNRRPTPRPIILYLMELRAHNAHAQNHAPRQQLTISTDWQAADGHPLPIKIKHLDPSDCGIPIVYG